MLSRRCEAARLIIQRNFQGKKGGHLMARSVNKVILAGHLGQDAQTKFTQGGTAVTHFSLATTRSWKNTNTDEWVEETNWTNVVLWRQENLANYLTKGKQIFVEGRLQARSYNDKEGRKVYVTEVIADEVLLLGGKNGQASDAAEPPLPSQVRSGKSAARAPQSASGNESASIGITDDDVPW
jgi:single-strand DNA-binding protein